MTEKEITINGNGYLKKATVYRNPDKAPAACILYFHGGGLLYGSRKDLPSLHIKTLTDAGYVIAAFDYPLAPYTKLHGIFEDIEASIRHYIMNPEVYAEESHAGTPLPYFLLGRSAGAYLCLLAAAKGSFTVPPLGVLSWYGYGFLTDGWYELPSPYYRSLPAVPESCLNSVPEEVTPEGTLDSRYGIYVYARQNGQWKNLIYNGRDKLFFLDYSLRACDSFPCPLFCAHSTGDTDVPYSEFLELCTRYQPSRFVISRNSHDFDRDEQDPATEKLLRESVAFMEKCLQRASLE